jgi:large subunit ribosomal protein L21
MYAVVEAGGKQYRVEEKQTLEVERIATPAGETVVLDKVLMIQGDDVQQIGAPHVDGARVLCRVVGEFKARKVVAFRYKAKENIRKKKGHRQRLTRLMVEKIETAG